MRKRLLLALPLPLAALSAFLLLRTYSLGLWRFNYPGHDEFPIRGIDVSHHQNEIDWDRIRTQRLRFVYIKATEGGTYKNPRFPDNWKSAGRIGLARGAYHFFTFCRPGADQAANFIAAVPIDPAALPPAIDLEYAGNCSERPAPAVLIQNLTAFSRAIEKAYGKPPVLYTGLKEYNTYFKGRPVSLKLWISDVLGRPRLPDGNEWAFWQYADNGRLVGVNGNVDLNVFKGSDASFRRLTTPISPVRGDSPSRTSGQR